jgi:hypothetical protein
VNISFFFYTFCLLFVSKDQSHELIFYAKLDRFVKSATKVNLKRKVIEEVLSNLLLHLWFC